MLEENSPSIHGRTKAAVHTLRFLAARKKAEVDDTRKNGQESAASRLAALPTLPPHSPRLGEMTNEEIRRATSLLAGCTFSDVTPGEATSSIMTALKGSQSDLTPVNVANAMITLASPQPGEKIIDPACGAGTLPGLCVARMTGEGNPHPRVTAQDKDHILVHMTKMLMTIAGAEDPNTKTTDSLAGVPEDDNGQGTFDVVLVHPPFGNKLTRNNRELLRKFTLGRRPGGADGETRQEQALQVLFIEAGLRMLRKGGRMAITLHDGVIGNPSCRYIWDYVDSVARVRAVISMPEETFAPEYTTKATMMLLEKQGERGKPVFMAVAHTAGRNRRGGSLVNTQESTLRKETDDQISAAAANFSNPPNTRRGFTVDESEIRDLNHIPTLYLAENRNQLQQLAKTGRFDMPTIGDLVKTGRLEISRGHAAKALPRELQEGIPFVRTSDVRDWAINWQPIMGVDPQEAEEFIRKQDLRPGDILLVCDGDSLIGQNAMVTPADGPMVIQGHLKKLRAKGDLDPHLLMFLINCSQVQQQFQEKIIAQATVGTLGKRLEEVVIPISKNPEDRDKMAGTAREIVDNLTQTTKAAKELMGI